MDFEQKKTARVKNPGRFLNYNFGNPNQVYNLILMPLS
ncbi:hypothetical protein BC751_1966 [Cecembia calidifontis]|uniref:Uncharacterized protein n=1 Tax=Cecembia calidifontis TaxID=1187080 RepID=A0A4Q7P8H4_9BACT|nr:hypothetical protein BC751_1966 [Cecembia calidifontis]